MDYANLRRSRLPTGNTAIRLYGQLERPAGRTQPPADRTYTVYRYPLQVDQPGGIERQDLVGIRRHGWHEDGRIDKDVGPGQAWCIHSPAWPGSS